jgi:MFS transporter, DHA2 family, methylenomycin A resistance protein
VATLSCMSEPTSVRPAEHSTVSSPRVVLVVMCAGYFLVLLDVTIVNVALPRIGSDLDASVSGLQWVVDGYAIALASLMLGAGTIGDIGGHKRVVLWGLAVFGLASLGCGLAPTTGALVGFRVLQGIGAALLLPGTLAVISHAFPEPGERARAIGLWAGIGSTALPAGPLLGGALVSGTGWRAVFFINVPIVLVALASATRIVRDDDTHANDRRLDVPGVLLGAALLALVTFTFIEAGHAGHRPALAAAVVAASGLLAALVIVERRASDPMLPPGLFRRAGFATANAVAATMNLTTLGLLFVLTLYLQRVQGRSALAAGVAVLPLFVPLGILAPLAGRLSAQRGPRLPMATGLLGVATGVALLTLAQPGSGYLELLPALLLWGSGLGILTPAVVAAAIGAVGSQRAGLASAVNNTARQAGGAIGIAAFGALAGQPGTPRFISGFHTAALIAAVLLVAAAAATLALAPAARSS